MDLSEIISKVQSGEISAPQAEFLINSLQKAPKRKPGRPKKAKAPSKKKGRPRQLSTYEKRIEIMAARVLLDVLNVPLTSMEKRKFLSERYCVSEKQIDRLITELNIRARNGEVDVCQLTGAVRFMTEQQKKDAFFDEILGRKQTVNVRAVELGRYANTNPTKPPIK